MMIMWLQVNTERSMTKDKQIRTTSGTLRFKMEKLPKFQLTLYCLDSLQIEVWIESTQDKISLVNYQLNLLSKFLCTSLAQIR
jgi:hypothetical protein